MGVEIGMKVLLTEDIDRTGKEYLLERGYQIKMGNGISSETVMQDAHDCDAILTRNAVITEEILKNTPKLKVVSMHGVGVNNIDVDAATRLGIQVTNAAGSNKLSVAEYTIGLIIDLARNIPLYDRELRAGNWNIRRVCGTDLEGKTLGIIGMGNIGSQVAKKASLGLGMKVIGYKRNAAGKRMDGTEVTSNLDEVIRNADFLSLHVPASPSTYHMIGEREFSEMKPDSYLINTARGQIVDTAALIHALTEKRIAGAALDVFEGETISADHPLLNFSNVIVSPHTAAFTRESLQRMALYSAIGVDEVLSGSEPTYPVNHIGKKSAKAVFQEDDSNCVLEKTG